MLDGVADCVSDRLDRQELEVFDGCRLEVDDNVYAMLAFDLVKLEQCVPNPWD
jgi:hypothetical protein